MNRNSNEGQVKVLFSYLKRSGYTLENKSFQLQLEGNPSFPSLKSFTDTLDYFEVENIAANVPVGAIDEMPKSFLASVLEESGLSIVVEVKKVGDKIKLNNGGSFNRTVSPQDFKIMWTGNILAVEPRQVANSHRFKPSNVFTFISVFACISLLAFMNLQAWQESIYFLLALGGIYLSYLAVREELGLYNRETSQLCNSSTSNTNCGEVISSGSSSIFGVKLTDASLSFFVVWFLGLAIWGANTTYFQILAWCCTPLVVYSLYTQAFVQKTWCPICMGIDAILIVFMITVLAIAGFSFSWSSADIIYSGQAIAFGFLVYTGWLFLKPLLIDSIQLKKTEIDFLKFKRDETIFRAVLNSNEYPNLTPFDPQYEIWFGNPNADLVITGITNPFCGYCSQAMHGYDQLLQKFGDKLRIRLVFNVSPDSRQEDNVALSSRLIELFKEDPHQALKATKEWYEEKVYDDWIAKYGVPQASIDKTGLAAHFEWCKSNQMTYTPMTLMGNHLLPRPYMAADLMGLVQDALESSNVSENIINEITH